MSPGTQNTKVGPDALGIARKDSEISKDEIKSRRPHYRKKQVWERKT
jgi:hypothetical protein